ncbi:MAG: zinc-regulated TonB-dependent outer membrane receptor, partial [Myxococcales bacterium]|nr:zinc-regulated TonB-dependent outer membrane receptor [Myxococcales bacterium]
MSRLTLSLVGLSALVWASPLAAQTELTPEELEAINNALQADSADASPSPTPGPLAGASSSLSSMNPAIALILDSALAWYSEDDPRPTGGHDAAQNGFNFQQLELSMGASVDPYFRLDSNIVFTLFGVEVEEAYLTTLALPGNLQVRAGQYLLPFGRINRTHPHTWSFADQPLVIGKFFGGEGARGLGAEVSWLAPLPWFVELVASVNNPAGECCTRSFANDTIDGPEDFLYTLGLNQFFDLNEDWSITWGISALLGPNDSGLDNRSEVYGTDLYVRYRPVASAERMALSWQTEALYRTRQVPGSRLEDWGLYSQLVWAINASWELGGRYDYVAGLSEDELNPEWTEARQREAVQ